jgi:hypothetical protein
MEHVFFRTYDELEIRRDGFLKSSSIDATTFYATNGANGDWNRHLSHRFLSRPNQIQRVAPKGYIDQLFLYFLRWWHSLDF